MSIYIQDPINLDQIAGYYGVPVITKLFQDRFSSYTFCNLRDPAYNDKSVFIIGESALWQLDIEKFKQINQFKLVLIIPSISVSFFDYHCYSPLTYLKDFADLLNLDYRHIYIVTRLASDKTVINTLLPGAHVTNHDVWSYEFHWEYFRKYIDEPPARKNTFNQKKFSVFSNRFDYDRFSIFCNLVALDIIKECHYSFGNRIGHVGNNFDVELKYLSQEIIDEKANVYTLSKKAKIKEWAKGIPYYLNNDPTLHYAFEVNDATERSDIAIVLENTINEHGGFLSEKIYRAIYFKKPFLLWSCVGALDVLKQNGFKTFSPFIDETYDNEKNKYTRQKLLLKEIEKLNGMDRNQMQKFILDTQEICNYNYTVLHDNLKQPLGLEFEIEKILSFHE